MRYALLLLVAMENILGGMIALAYGFDWVFWPTMIIGLACVVLMFVDINKVSGGVHHVRSPRL